MKQRDKDIINAEDKLKRLEDDYVSACSRFINRNPSKDQVWFLKNGEGELKALLLNSRSTLVPVFANLKNIPNPNFLKGFFRMKKLHAIQGLKQEVTILEDIMEQFGRGISESFDYDLMSLELQEVGISNLRFGELEPSVRRAGGLVLRPARMSDLDALAPLQRAYEHEEVRHKLYVYSPLASRINLSNIVAGGKILVAELNGQLIGKINVNGISFTKYQIGGVFVHPDFRGKGIARLMTAKFLTSLVNESPKPGGFSLFVKKSNTAACRLYVGLGFKVRGDYRITYLDNQ